MLPDMAEARALITPFFLSELTDTKHGTEDIHPPLLDQLGRARLLPPPLRNHSSNINRPDSF